MSNPSESAVDPLAQSAQRMVDQILSSSFVRESWDDLEAHARHALSLLDRDAPPSRESVAMVVAMELNLIAVAAETDPRWRAQVAKARPYIEARLAERELPDVPLVDLLATLDLIRVALAGLIAYLNHH